MTKVDQFESVFRSASKPVFSLDPVRIEKVLVVTDLEEGEGKAQLEMTKEFLTALLPDSPEWALALGRDYASVKDLLDVVERHRPSLICTYRHLHSSGWEWGFSMGEHLDVLTQATTTPVIVMPHPKAARAADHALRDTNVVMAMTNHLTGDHRLVSFAAHFTSKEGVLFLTHIEDQAVFDQYLTTISKIPQIDTETAKEEIAHQLLKEPRDYIRSCRAELDKKRGGLRVEEKVRFGHHLSEYGGLVDEHHVDLLVMNTKDEDQLAMHGLAYPLAVELRQIPLLLL